MMRALLALIRYFSGQRQVLILRQIDGADGRLLGVALKSKFRLRIGKHGEGQREIGIIIRRQLQVLERIQILARAHQHRSLVEFTQRIDRFRVGLERLGLQLLDHIGGERKVLAHRVGQAVDGRGQIFYQRLRFDGDSLVMRQVANGRVDHDLIAEACIFARNQNVGIAELGHAAQRIRIDRGLRAYMKIRKHLVQPIGRDGVQMRRLTDVGAEHVRYARADPVVLGIAGGVAEG